MASTPSLWTYNVRRTRQTWREWWAGDRNNRRLQAGSVWNENIVVNPGRGDPPLSHPAMTCISPRCRRWPSRVVSAGTTRTLPGARL
ncbi:hypothetical protein BDZ89DRAFT_82628 [Hymenopellis radicata]|nr:hypothetical protein BDZ89DRAFT_82628 [Hymenopellis radicata]